MRMKRADRKAQILEILRARPEVRNRQRHLAEDMNVTQQVVSIVLRDMIEEGSVIRTKDRGYHEAPQKETTA